MTFVSSYDTVEKLFSAIACRNTEQCVTSASACLNCVYYIFMLLNRNVVQIVNSHIIHFSQVSWLPWLPTGYHWLPLVTTGYHWLPTGYHWLPTCQSSLHLSFCLDYRIKLFNFGIYEFDFSMSYFEKCI